MTSARKVASNRTNARQSTGPKTAKGKARSARNSRRHGLSVPVLSDPALCQEVEALAQQFAGADARPEIQELARRVAEAQVDTRRGRTLRHHFIARALRDSNYDSPSNWNKRLLCALRIIEKCCTHKNVPEHELTLMGSYPDGPEKFVVILADISARLPRLDRYERRALSRRKTAIRAFDEARAGVVTSIGPNAPDGGESGTP